MGATIPRLELVSQASPLLHGSATGPRDSAGGSMSTVQPMWHPWSLEAHMVMNTTSNKY